MKNPPRLVVEDAVEIFVAVAVRRGVLDDHVVIGQLLAAQHVQPVKHALDARLGQAHAQVVARQPRAKRDRVERILCVAAQLRVQRRQVKRPVRLILKLDVLDVRPVADARLGDDVGHARRLAKREVRLDDRALRVGPGDDPVADVRRFSVPARRGDEQQMNRLGQALAVTDLNQCAVGEKGIVECDKRIVIATGKRSKLALQAGQAAGQVGHRHAAWLVGGLRQPSVKMAIDKDQPISVQLAERDIAKLLLAKRLATR